MFVKNKKLKILHVYKSYYPDTIGGVEKFIENLINETKKKNVSSSIITVSDNRSSKNVIRCKKSFEIFSTPFSIQFLKKYKEIEKNFDIIHYHYPWPLMDIAALLFSKNKKKIVTYHSDIVKQKIIKFIYFPVMYFFLSSVKLIICSSNNYLSSSSILNIFKDKVKVIPFGIKKFFLTNKNENKKFVLKYGSDYILFVGTYRYYKGLEYLISAIQNSNYKLIIVGKNNKKKLKRLTNIKNPNIIFVNYASNKYLNLFYKNCRCVILPSHLRSEAFGISLLEGLSHNKPLVSCDIKTGTSYINIHNKTGYVVKKKSPKDLRKAIDKIFRNKNYFIKYSNYWFNKNFTLDKMGKRYYKIYKNL